MRGAETLSPERAAALDMKARLRLSFPDDAAQGVRSRPRRNGISGDPLLSSLVKVGAANLAVTVILLLGLEAGAELLGTHVRFLKLPRSSDPRIYAYDRTKGWFHVPGSHGQSFLGGPDQGSVRINALGLRGPELGSKKPGTRRVLVFGDSFVFGVGVDEEHLLTSQLEILFNATSDGRFEVVNMGVSGYSTDQEYILMQELGVDLSPDLVVVVVCDNDFPGNIEDFSYQRYYKPYFEVGPDGTLHPRNSPVPELEGFRRAKLWLGEHSSLWNFARTRRADGPRLQWILDGFEVRVPRSASMEEQVRVTFALIRAFRDLAEHAGAGFAVMNTGHLDEAAPPYAALRPRLTSAHVDWIAMEGPLQAARRRAPKGDWGFPGNAHWNRDAHRLAAETLHGHLWPP